MAEKPKTRRWQMDEGDGRTQEKRAGLKTGRYIPLHGIDFKKGLAVIKDLTLRGCRRQWKLVWKD
ncbi:MAG: hypothetical protein WBL63_17920, partial [Candidatus Acidiferrum sp.]